VNGLSRQPPGRTCGGARPNVGTDSPAPLLEQQKALARAKCQTETSQKKVVLRYSNVLSEIAKS